MQFASSIQLNDEEGAMIWKFNSSGKYSAQSQYAMVNDRGGGGGLDKSIPLSCGRF
jgi:hypothetical protein